MKVQVRGLHKRFGKTVAVDNFTFSFDNGHVFGFVGQIRNAGRADTTVGCDE